MQQTTELAPRENEMPVYEAPVVVSYDRQAIVEILGPARTSGGATGSTL